MNESYEGLRSPPPPPPPASRPCREDHRSFARRSCTAVRCCAAFDAVPPRLAPHRTMDCRRRLRSEAKVTQKPSTAHAAASPISSSCIFATLSAVVPRTSVSASSSVPALWGELRNDASLKPSPIASSSLSVSPSRPAHLPIARPSPP